MQLPEESLALRLPPSQLASYVLEGLARDWRSDPSPFTFRSKFSNVKDEPLRLAYAEAWSWLRREGFLVPDPNPRLAIEPVNLVPSRAARAIQSVRDFEELRKRLLLLRDLVDARIAARVEADFFASAFDNAVNSAFREVEITVRAAAKLPAASFGVALMREAFHETSGPLTDPSASLPERQAVSGLCSGAMGLYRNPTAHRVVGLNAEQSVELFVLASHLLHVVDARCSASAGISGNP
jgi:hypothetical protein